jgi:pimeloyl-ACP methyl ester carboxylesterase
MENLRKYGKPPFNIAVVHGGPGAPGEMAPVARELAQNRGVLEPLQTEETMHGQIDELKTVLEENAEFPVILIGHSWGAMLSYMLTAQEQSLVRKLILVDSGVFDDKYAAEIGKTRISRLSEEERPVLRSLSEMLDYQNSEEKNGMFAQVGKLVLKADSYDPFPDESEVIEYQYDIYESVWKEVTDLRSSGGLVALGKWIRCPVVAIHGDYDPHPPAGVRDPLSQVIKDFRFILLENCGHTPWIERQAKDRFYKILREESE